MRLRYVIKRHHHQAEKDHGRDGADPIPVGRHDAVLICRSRPAEELERSQVCRNKSQSRNPCSHLTTGKEKVFTSVGELLEIEPDRKHQAKVDNDDREIYGRKMYQPLCYIHRKEWGHLVSFLNLVRTCW